ncbi:SpnT protein, partial [Salmonella enterica]|nr:SpnT protein [Salmonella enterica]
MSKLNQKQLKLLREMSVEQMTNIICSLVEDNRQAKHLLISNYLSTPDESLKKAEAEYNRKIKTKRFYDYYEADAFFDESHRNIALPLEKIVSVIPEKTEAFCHNLLLTFNKLNEIA